MKDDDKKKSLNKWVANFCEILWTKVTELDRKDEDEDETKTKTNFLDKMNPRILPTPYGGRKVVFMTSSFINHYLMSLFYMIWAISDVEYTRKGLIA